MRVVTVADIKRRARARADMKSTNFVDDEELMDMINEAYTELYDTLVQAFENYYTQEQTITLIPGTTTYDLPDTFYKMISVDFQTGSNAWTTLFRYNEMERNSTLSTTGSIPNGTVRFRFIPAPAVLEDDDDEIDGVSGWDALLVTDVAIMMLDKEESNTDRLERRRQRLMSRIMSAAQNRDVGMPGSVTDITVYDDASFYNALRYRFYGNTVEFINVEYVGI